MSKGDEFREMLRAAVADHGVGERRFEQDHGLPKWSLRGILDPNRNQTPNLDKAEEICARLGWRLRIDAIRPFDAARYLPVRGWARCGVEGWGAPDQQPAPAPAPADWTGAGFYARALGHSMRPEGVASGAYALIDDSRAARVGDRVWVEDFQGRASLKRLISRTDETIGLRGWLDPVAGEQQSFEIEMIRKFTRALHPVDRVYSCAPGGDAPADETPDPKPPQQPAQQQPGDGVDGDADADADANDIAARLQRIEDKLNQLLHRGGG